MITINLLPDDRKKAKERFKKIDLSEFKLEHTAVLGIIGAIAGVIAAAYIAILAATFIFQSSEKGLVKQYEAISAQKKEADSLRGEIALINKKVKAIDELMVNRFSWTRKLEEINESMIPGVWLSEVSYDERASGPTVSGRPGRAQAAPKITSRYIVLGGYALNSSGEGNATIAKFIKSLENNKGFYGDLHDIQLQFTKLEKMLDQDVLVFRLTCNFKETKKR